MKVSVAASLSLLLLGAAKGNQPTEIACNVRYDQVTRFTYNQPVADRPLPGLAIKGRYADAAPSFEYFDDDGFLTLTMLLSSWQSTGLTARNVVAPEPISRADLLLLRDASAVGRGFFNAIVAYAARKTDLSNDQRAEVDAAKAHLALWDRLDLQAGKSLQAPAGKTTIPAGFIAQAGTYLERLRPGAKDSIVSRYRDISAGATSRLCDPAASNPLLAQILCDSNLATGAARATPVCRAGSTISSPATALNCDATLVAGLPKPSRCTAGAGGPPTALPD